MNYEVATREMPARRILCLERNADSDDAVRALGKEFLAIFRDRPRPLLPGREGAPFLVYHGEVGPDGDGPVEFCRPVADDGSEALAGRYPELVLRTEEAHEEAFVHLGTDQLSAPEWQLVSEALFGWATDHRREPSDLGVRVTFLVTPPVVANSAPDCDFAVPLR